VTSCINLSGTIKWENNIALGVKDATVKLTGSAIDTKLTDVNGDYNLIANISGNFTVKPTKNINLLNGVTSADATRIQQHLAGTNPLPTPYKRIAADVNKSNSITTVDAALITQALMGNPVALAILNTSWRFVPAEYSFPIPLAPWGFPEQINLSSITTDQSNLNFIGVKLGDVDGTANPATAPVTPLTWMVEDQMLTEGQEVTVEFGASHFNDLAAYQFALNFDPTVLQLSDIQPTAALNLNTVDNFGLYNAANGEIRSVWSTAQGVTLPEGAVVFKLKFTVQQGNLKLSDVLHLDNTALQGLAYNTVLREAPVHIAFKDAQVVATTDPVDAKPKLQLMQNQPNPFVDRTVIGFVLPEACEAQIRIIDLDGKVLETRKKTYTAGYQEEEFRIENQITSGLLYYELTTPSGKLAKKMIFIGK
jgi:hypothetical protein